MKWRSTRNCAACASASVFMMSARNWPSSWTCTASSSPGACRAMPAPGAGSTAPPTIWKRSCRGKFATRSSVSSWRISSSLWACWKTIFPKTSSPMDMRPIWSGVIPMSIPTKRLKCVSRAGWKASVWPPASYRRAPLQTSMNLSGTSNISLMSRQIIDRTSLSSRNYSPYACCLLKRRSFPHWRQSTSWQTIHRAWRRNWRGWRWNIISTSSAAPTRPALTTAISRTSPMSPCGMVRFTPRKKSTRRPTRHSGGTSKAAIRWTSFRPTAGRSVYSSVMTVNSPNSPAVWSIRVRA